MKRPIYKKSAAAVGASMFMCAILCAVYLISTTPESEPEKKRALGDAVAVSSGVSAAYDEAELLKTELSAAYIDGDITGAELVEAFMELDD